MGEKGAHAHTHVAETGNRPSFSNPGSSITPPQFAIGVIKNSRRRGTVLRNKLG
jgi:hypothetical protein